MSLLLVLKNFVKNNIFISIICIKRQIYNYIIINLYLLTVYETLYTKPIYTKKYKNFAKTDWYVYETLAFLHYSTESYIKCRNINYIYEDNVYINVNRIIPIFLISRVKSQYVYKFNITQKYKVLSPIIFISSIFLSQSVYN